MDPVEPIAPPSAEPAAALVCPECGYNLVGTPEDRCPECGVAFDRADLLGRCSQREMPFCPWDSPRGQKNAIEIFFETWGAALGSPRRLFKTYPARPIAHRAAAYSLVCYGIVLALGLIGGFLASPMQPVCGMGLAVGIGMSFTALLCEMLLAAIFNGLVTPRLAQSSYALWRGATHYFSGFLVLSALLIAWTFFSVAAAGAGMAYLLALNSGAACLLFAWWALALAAAVFQISRPSWSRVLACVLIWPVGVGAVFGGFFISTFLAASVGRM